MYHVTKPKTKIKPLVACLLTTMFATHANAADPVTPTTATTATPSSTIKTTNSDVGKPVNPDDSKYTDQQVKDYFTNTGVPPGTPLLAMPQKFRRSAGRFGEFRTRNGGSGYHGGLDMTPSSLSRSGLAMKAPGEGVVVKSYYGGGIGNTVVVKRPNGDKYQFLHMKNNINRSNPKGSAVKQGMPLGVVGATGGTFPIHLHFNYILPNGNPSRWRNIWLSKATKKGSSRFTLHNNAGTRKKISGAATDPTPYLAEDLRVAPDGYSKWLGSTIRQQFNTLYNTKLPLGGGARANLKALPAIPIFSHGYEWTPENIAAAKGSLVNGAKVADWSGYSAAFDNTAMTAQVAASFISAMDGKQFGSLPQPTTPVGVDTMSARQIVDFVSTKRYGNDAWQKSMMGLSSKGLVTELAMMNATENYLKQQNQKLTNRVELLLAGLNQARLFEFNKSIEAMQIEATADYVPDVIDLELKDLGYAPLNSVSSIDPANLPNELNALIKALMDMISHGEGDYNAYNTGQYGRCKMKGYFNTAQAQRAGTTLVTQLTPRQMWNKATKLSNCNKDRRFAVGRYQLIYETLAGSQKQGFGGGGFIAAYPSYADKIFTEEVQDFAARNYLLLGRKRPTLAKFLKGNLSVSHRTVMLNLAREWASIAAPLGEKLHNSDVISDGTQSYYGQGNKASAKSTAEVDAVIRKIRQWHLNNPGKAKDVLSGKIIEKPTQPPSEATDGATDVATVDTNTTTAKTTN